MFKDKRMNLIKNFKNIKNLVNKESLNKVIKQVVN